MNNLWLGLDSSTSDKTSIDNPTSTLGSETGVHHLRARVRAAKSATADRNHLLNHRWWASGGWAAVAQRTLPGIAEVNMRR